MSQSPLEPEIVDAEPAAPATHQRSPYAADHNPAHLQSPAHTPTSKGFPWGCLIGGCLTALLLMLVSLGAIGFFSYRYFQQQVAQYTSQQPRLLPVVEVSPEKLQQLEIEVKQFQEMVEKGDTPEPLVLSSDDLNALLSQQEALRGRVFVTIEDGLIQADVSFPTDAIPGAQGRFFNGSVGVDASLENGVLIVTLENAEVNGQDVPETIMSQLRKENLAKEAYKDPEVAKTLSKFKSLVIEGDKLILTPNPTVLPGDKTESAGD